MHFLLALTIVDSKDHIVGVEEVGGDLRVSWEVVLISNNVLKCECCKEPVCRVDLMKSIGGEQWTLTESLRVGSLSGWWGGMWWLSERGMQWLSGGRGEGGQMQVLEVDCHRWWWL
jgi:hypothetical protein